MLYEKAGRHDKALRLAQKFGLQGEIMAISSVAAPEEMAQSAKYGIDIYN